MYVCVYLSVCIIYYNNNIIIIIHDIVSERCSYSSNINTVLKCHFSTCIMIFMHVQLVKNCGELAEIDLKVCVCVCVCVYECIQYYVCMWRVTVIDSNLLLVVLSFIVTVSR